MPAMLQPPRVFPFRMELRIEVEALEIIELERSPIRKADRLFLGAL
jgi:hypothetical protein